MPVRSGIVIKNCKIDEAKKENVSVIQYDVHFTHLDVNNTVVTLRKYINSVRKNPIKLDASPISLCYQDEALSDKEGNIFFGGIDFWDKTLLLFFNRTIEAVTKIRFQPEINPKTRLFPFFKANILFDERENLWFLFSFCMRSFMGPNTFSFNTDKDGSLYYLEKGSFTAQKIPDSQNFYRVLKNEKEDIFILSSSGLYFNSLN